MRGPSTVTTSMTVNHPAPALLAIAGELDAGRLPDAELRTMLDTATIVAFRCTNHFGDHHHYDQGSFLIWHNGLLAVDPPVYRKVRGPQQLTENHNTLLVGGRPQRPVRGQWFTTVEEFQKKYAEIPDEQKLDFIVHNIRRGETLAGIAKKYGVSVASLRDANRLNARRSG